MPLTEITLLSSLTGHTLQKVWLHKIKPEITKIPMSGIDDAWTKVFEKKARYRYVMDMKA
jgi:D-arabinose 1-dehydrogenase-like Zn-dependent alcohol dehydrogenase